MQPKPEGGPTGPGFAGPEPPGDLPVAKAQPHTSSHDQPMVSVIVPVLNDAAGIRRCVESLQRQSYPRDRFEIIVVDNGSTDGTAELLEGLGISALGETAIRGSYAARNAGLRAAVGTVMAFTDADCVPCQRWLEEGVRAMQARRADLVGGNVRFDLSMRPTGAEMWDAVTNMQVEQNVRERQVAKTANLFVHESVFDAIGPFPGTMRSGGDVAWTGEATRNGFTLVFSPTAEVVHPARRLGRLMAKQFRVGLGQGVIGKITGSRRSDALRRALHQLAPPTRGLVATQLAAKGKQANRLLFTRIWLAAWLCRAATGAGSLAAGLRPRAGQGSPP